MSSTSNKAIPRLTTDEEAERFVEGTDLSEYDLSGFRPAGFEFGAKDARINMRLPKAQLDAVRSAAEKRGIPYQRFIREAIDKALEKQSKG